MQQVLTALQILGRGNCFDDICQLSLMSKPMAAATFHKFCKHFAQELFEEHIYLPTGSYQDVSCAFNHAGRAIAITSGFTGETNHKTIIRYDAGVHTVKTDAQYTKRTYKLRRADGTFRERKGCYLIVDNGYHEVNSLGHPNRMREDNPLAGNTRAGLL
ncbi:unnamed protein product [Ectocarpus sp. CCAP 1310/34]|nr:unnamed protein product [Ectocarpus sp. CCAP 1310/34]